MVLLLESKKLRERAPLERRALAKY